MDPVSRRFIGNEGVTCLPHTMTVAFPRKTPEQQRADPTWRPIR